MGAGNIDVVMLAAGTLTEAALQADNANVIENFPVQSDQGGIPWRALLLDVVRDPQEVVALDKSVGLFGGVTIPLVWDRLTPKMMSYLRSAKLGAAASNLATTISGPVTVQVQHPIHGWLVYNGTMVFKLPGDGIQSKPLFANVVTVINGAVQATAGYGYSKGFSLGFDS